MDVDTFEPISCVSLSMRLETFILLLSCVKLKFSLTIIAVTMAATGEAPKEQLLKQEVQGGSRELEMGREGNVMSLHVFVANFDICQC